MPLPSLYLDENVDQRILPELLRSGLDILTVQDAHTASADDESQLLHATTLERVLVTHNQVHFRRLHERFGAEGRVHAGIILIPHTLPPSRLLVRVQLMADWAGSFPETHTRLLTWSHLQQLLIHDYRPPATRCSEDDVRHALAWT